MPENFMPSVLAHQPLPSRRHLQLLALLTLHGRLNITAAARLLCLSGACASPRTSLTCQTNAWCSGFGMKSLRSRPTGVRPA